MEPVILRTARLELSLPTEADVDAIYAACQDFEIQRYTTVPSPYERTHAEGFITQVADEWASGQHVTWLIREGSSLVGAIGLYRLDGRGNGELGYWIAPDQRGGRRLLEAADAVIHWGFSPDGLGLVRISWRAVVGNTASARAARTLGFHFEGTQRQALVNAIGRDDGWLAGLLATDDRMPQPWPVLDV